MTLNRVEGYPAVCWRHDLSMKISLNFYSRSSSMALSHHNTKSLYRTCLTEVHAEYISIVTTLLTKGYTTCTIIIFVQLHCGYSDVGASASLPRAATSPANTEAVPYESKSTIIIVIILYTTKNIFRKCRFVS